MTPHPQRCETLKTLYDYCVEQFTSAEDNSDVETAFEKMLVLFPQTHYNRTGIWNGCAFPAATERDKTLDEYYIDFEENGGEYTGHLRICTPDKLEFDGDRTLKTNGVIIKLDEKIELVEKQEPRTAPAGDQ